ncbi:MAG: hypothetical protein R2712_26620 [Vicinamibacterales bacterium]
MACVAPTPPPDLDTIASRYIQRTRDLARHDPSLVDHWLREPPPPTAPRRPVRDLADEIRVLSADADRAWAAAADDAARERAAHLQRQLTALTLAARRLLGESPPFDEEARLGFGLDPIALEETPLRTAREALDREVPGAGSLATRVDAFRASFRVPDDRRDLVMRLALDACRTATAAAFHLPSDESVELRFVAGLPWDAHAEYLGAHRTRIEINAAPLDLSRALRLACHEGYAGHHAQYIWLDDEVLGTRGWSEFALVPGFGPDLLAAEGTAEAGTDLAMPPDARLRVYREALAPAAGIAAADLDRLVRVEGLLAALEPAIGDIARAYLDNRINASTAAERLTDEVLMADSAGFVTFIERRRSRLLAYAEGGRRALAAVRTHGGLAALRPLMVSLACRAERRPA